MPELDVDYQAAADDFMRQDREANYGISLRSCVFRYTTGRIRVYVDFCAAPCLGPCFLACGGLHGGSRSRRTECDLTIVFMLIPG